MAMIKRYIYFSAIVAIALETCFGSITTRAGNEILSSSIASLRELLKDIKANTLNEAGEGILEDIRAKQLKEAGEGRKLMSAGLNATATGACKAVNSESSIAKLQAAVAATLKKFEMQSLESSPEKLFEPRKIESDCSLSCESNGRYTIQSKSNGLIEKAWVSARAKQQLPAEAEEDKAESSGGPDGYSRFLDSQDSTRFNIHDPLSQGTVQDISVIVEEIQSGDHLYQKTEEYLGLKNEPLARPMITTLARVSSKQTFENALFCKPKQNGSELCNPLSILFSGGQAFHTCKITFPKKAPQVPGEVRSFRVSGLFPLNGKNQKFEFTVPLLPNEFFAASCAEGKQFNQIHPRVSKKQLVKMEGGGKDRQLWDTNSPDYFLQNIPAFDDDEGIKKYTKLCSAYKNSSI